MFIFLHLFCTNKISKEVFEIESVSEVIVKVFVKTLMEVRLEMYVEFYLEKLTRENIAVIQSCCPIPCTLSMGSAFV